MQMKAATVTWSQLQMSILDLSSLLMTIHICRKAVPYGILIENNCFVVMKIIVAKLWFQSMINNVTFFSGTIIWALIYLEVDIQAMKHKQFQKHGR